MVSDQRYAPFRVIIAPEARLELPAGHVELLEQITYRPGYQLHINTDGHREYAQVRCWRPDTYTGQWAWGAGGKGWLSPHMASNELIQMIFGLFKAYEEHETREWFRWNGRTVFGPHVPLVAAWTAAEHTEHRAGR